MTVTKPKGKGVVLGGWSTLVSRLPHCHQRDHLGGVVKGSFTTLRVGKEAFTAR